MNDPQNPYWPRYEGDEDTRRKPAYHNGTAWTWTFPVFCEALARAWGEGRPDPFAAFERVGRAYLAFARTEPAYYSAMFEAGVPLEISQELRDAGDRAFLVIRGAAERLVALIPAARRPPAFMVALHVWSLAHGIASLFGRGDAGRRKVPMQPEELLEAGVLVYLRGLGLPNDAAIAP